MKKIFIVSLLSIIICFAIGEKALSQSCQMKLTFSGNYTNLPCNGIGNVKVTPSGGTGPYSYTWGSFQWPSVYKTDSVNVQPGQWTVQVTDSKGCKETETINVTTVMTSAMSISPDTTICYGTCIPRSATGGVSYFWMPDYIVDSTFKTTPWTTTVFTVLIIDANGCTGVLTDTVTVRKVDITVNPTKATICAGDSVTLTAYSPTGASYDWGNAGKGTNIKVAPLVNESYTVWVFDSANCPNIATIDVTVNQSPDITINGNNPICLGSSLTLTASSSNAINYSWNSGPTGSTYTITPPSGTTPVIATVVDTNGCSKSDTVNVIPYDPPVISVNSTSTCINSPVTLTPAVTGTTPYNYLWSNNATTSSISVTPTSTGTLTYTFTVTDGHNCSVVDTAQVMVNNFLNVQMQLDTEICIGNSANIYVAAPNNAATYQWTGISGNTSAVTVSPTSTSFYNVTVSDANGCSGTGTIKVSVNPLPVISILGPVELCTGSSITLTGSGGSSYSWTTVGTTGNSILISPTSNSSYAVTGTDSKGCSNTASTSITVNPLPVPQISQPSTICKGMQMTITASGGNSYLWNNGATDSGIIVSPTSTTSYMVTVTDAKNCSNTATTQITYSPNSGPVVSVSANSNICQGSSIQLTAGGANSYNWNPTSAGLNLYNVPDPVATPLATTTYTVTASDLNGCSTSKTVTVTVQTLPQACASDKEICAGATVSLDGDCSTPSMIYNWSPTTDLSNPASLKPLFTGQNTMSYILTVSDPASVCPPSFDTVTVTVHQLPVVIATVDSSEILAGEEVHLNALGTGTSYSWMPSEGLSCSTCASPVSIPLQSTYYIVTAFDNLGCRNSDTVLVDVDDIITLYVPTAFNPSSGDANSIIRASGIGVQDLEFYIFNRWGELIFESHDLNKGWNGTYKGQEVQEDVYVYLAKALSITGKTLTRVGAITVVR